MNEILSFVSAVFDTILFLFWFLSNRMVSGDPYLALTPSAVVLNEEALNLEGQWRSRNAFQCCTRNWGLCDLSLLCTVDRCWVCDDPCNAFNKMIIDPLVFFTICLSDRYQRNDDRNVSTRVFLTFGTTDVETLVAAQRLDHKIWFPADTYTLLPGLDVTRLFISLTAGAGTRCMEPSLFTIVEKECSPKRRCCWNF